ncbi:MAG: hypothetical protein ACK5PZ_17515, partial [Pirellula sp.]
MNQNPPRERTLLHGNTFSRNPHPMETKAGVLDRLTKTRLLYFLSAIAVVVAGLLSRRYQARLPQFIAEYAGDTLWALMVYLLVSTLLARRSCSFRACIAI